MRTVRTVKFQGCPVGNLWDIMDDNKFVARIAFEDNILKVIEGERRINLIEIERMIDDIWKMSMN